MNRTKNLINNTLIIALGKVSTQFISFLLLPLYTSFLTTDDYGIVDLIMTYVALIAPIVTLQLEMATFRFLVDARHDRHQKTKIISNALLAVGVFMLLFIAIYIVTSLVFDIMYGLYILLSIVVTILLNLFMQFARGLGDNKRFAIAGVAAGITGIILNIFFIAILHMGAVGMLLAMIMANIMGCVYLFFALKLHKFVIFQRDKKVTNDLLKYSFPLVPNGLSWWLINASDRTIIALILGTSANGIFAIAYKFPIVFTTLYSFFNLSWTESASIHINDKDKDHFFSNATNASLKLFGSLGLLMIVLIPFVFNYLVDEKFAEAYMYIPILIIGSFFNSIVGSYSAIYIAKKMTKQVATTSMFAAAISIIINLVLIHFIGLYAAAIATAVAYLGMSIYRHYDVKKYILIKYEKNTFIGLGVFYIIALSLYYYNHSFGNIINLTVILLYILLLNKKTLKILKKQLYETVNRRKI